MISAQQQFVNMTARDCAGLLWTILDSRQFFREGYNPTVPACSTLGTALTMLMSDHIVVSRSVPYANLLAGTAGANQHDTPFANGDPSPPSSSGHKMAVPPTLCNKITQIKALSTGCTALTLLELADPGTLSLGPPQSCLQLRYFGACKSNTCTYKHGKAPAPTAQETKAVTSLKQIIKKLRNATTSPDALVLSASGT
jgi:hypothetical protein